MIPLNLARGLWMITCAISTDGEHFPAENTKTKHPRTSYLPKGLMNEMKSMLKQKGMVTKRVCRIRRPNAYLFHPSRRWNQSYTENRIWQVFQQYIERADLQRIYAEDGSGRNLKMFTVHSLRHSHIMHYTVDRGLPLPIVQKQVGHRILKTTSVYLAPSTQVIAEAYSKSRSA